ncbi:MAG: hypothetical protein V8T31_07185 [Lachnospiraceae bacterium]
MKKSGWTMRKAIMVFCVGCVMAALLMQTFLFQQSLKRQIRTESIADNENTLTFMLTFTIVIFVVAYLAFTYTGLGSRLKAIGAGETAARFAGIRVDSTKMLIYMTAGCITGLAAFINSVKVGSVTSTAGNQLETQIMIALVLGGMPVNGGAKVRFYNIILGVMTYKVLSSGLVMLMIPTQLQQLILGIIFLIEVALFSDRKTGMIVK